MIRGDPLYTDGNDDFPKSGLGIINTATGLEVPDTGHAGLSFRLAATPNGSAIHATLSKSATEGWTDGPKRFYYATYEGTDLTTQLATYVGKDVYQTFSDGANVNYVVMRKVLAVRP